jgi:hypothetical protein
VHAASLSSSKRSMPLRGGAASNWPITEKRKCAHCSCTRDPRRCDTPTRPNARSRTVGQRSAGRRRACSAGRRCSSCSVHCRVSAERQNEAQQRDEPRRGAAGKALEQRAGSRPRSAGGMKAAAATFQNGLAANALPHHVRQRPMVCRLTPKAPSTAGLPSPLAASPQPAAPRRRVRPCGRGSGTTAASCDSGRDPPSSRS